MTRAVHVPYTVEHDEDDVWCAHALHQGRDVAKGALRGILSDVGMTIEELHRVV